MTSRIYALPWRDPARPDPATVQVLTEWLRRPGGAQTLLPIQAQALAELASYGWLTAFARVGAGKTLISTLAPIVVGAKRPLLVVPAHMLDHDTPTALAEISRHWQTLRPMKWVRGLRPQDHPGTLWLTSYHRIGVKSGADLLDQIDPDMLLLDEAHLIRRKYEASRARRIYRWRKAHPDAWVVGLSGTPTRESVCDYAPLLTLCGGVRAPVPGDPDTLDAWAAVLDDRPKKTWVIPDPQVLEPHVGGPITDIASARERYRHRLTWTPGVILSDDTFADTQCTISPLHWPTPQCLDEHFARLRTLWVTPDDWPLLDEARGVWSAAQRLALGGYYYHVPRPPQEYIDARRAWGAFCRNVLESSQEYDSELQIREACQDGRLPRNVWDTWDQIRHTYTYTKHVTWLSDHALLGAQHWGRRQAGPAIIWTAFAAFGHELASRTGWPYYGAEGKCASGAHISTAREPVIIVSEKSSSEGRNLQYYRHNLYLSPPAKSIDWEQRTARTYRYGQTQDVTVDYVVGCCENWVALEAALGYARGTHAREGMTPILLTAACTLPKVEWLAGPAYVKP